MRARMHAPQKSAHTAAADIPVHIRTLVLRGFVVEQRNAHYAAVAKFRRDLMLYKDSLKPNYKATYRAVLVAFLPTCAHRYFWHVRAGQHSQRSATRTAVCKQYN